MRTGWSDGGDETAVDDEVAAVDVAGAVTGQQQHEIGNFLRRRETAGRTVGGSAAGDLVRTKTAGLRDGFGNTTGAQPQVGLHRPGTDRVDPYAARTELLGQRLRQ